MGHRPGAPAGRLCEVAGQVTGLRCQLGRAWPSGGRDPGRSGLGAGTAHRRHDGRDRGTRRPHALPFLRYPGHARSGRRPHRPVLWPPRQAARDERLARRSRPLEAGDRRRQALWSRRSRRRLCAVCRPHGGAGHGRAEGGAPALRGSDRDLRRKRQPRSAAIPRQARAASGRGAARGRPRFRLRQLRPDVGHHLPARAGGRRADGRGAAGGRALGLGQRHRPLVVSHRPQAAQPPR